MSEHSLDPNWKLRTIIPSDLTPGQKLAQSAHGFCEFAFEHREAFTEWKAASNSVIVLETPDLEAFLARARESGIAYSTFHEPDMDGRLTAVTLAPSVLARKLTSSLRLAGRCP